MKQLYSNKNVKKNKQPNMKIICEYLIIKTSLDPKHLEAESRLEKSAQKTSRSYSPMPTSDKFNVDRK